MIEQPPNSCMVDKLLAGMIWWKLESKERDIDIVTVRLLVGTTVDVNKYPSKRYSIVYIYK